MVHQQQHSTEEILIAIGGEMKAQTEHLSKIRLYVGFLALVTFVSIVLTFLALALGS